MAECGGGRRCLCAQRCLRYSVCADVALVDACPTTDGVHRQTATPLGTPRTPDAQTHNPLVDTDAQTLAEKEALHFGREGLKSIERWVMRHNSYAEVVDGDDVERTVRGSIAAAGALFKTRRWRGPAQQAIDSARD